MKIHILLITATVILLSASQVKAVEYEVVILGTLGGEYSYAYAINDSGQVVGQSYTSDNQIRAFLWDKDNGMQNLGVLEIPGNPGQPYYSCATGINNSGQIVGYSGYYDGPERAFLWENGQMCDLGSLGGTDSHATGINNQGQIVGYSKNSNGDIRAFLWHNGIMQDIGTLEGRTTYAHGINDNGQVIGESYTSNGYNAFIWDNGIMNNLGTINQYGSVAKGINNSGQITGSITPEKIYIRQEAVLWDNNSITALGYLDANDPRSYGQAINEHGQIVGFSLLRIGPSNPGHACLWENCEIVDLDIYFPENIHANYAYGINNSGQIVGCIEIGGRRRAFLMTPIPEPTTRLAPAEYPTIQSAIDACNDGDEVVVAPGTYTGDGNRNISFGGMSITVRSIDPSDPNVVASTIIDCNGTKDDPHRGFCFNSSEDVNSVIAGFTIIRGYAPNEDIGPQFPLSAGGAVFCGNASPRISKCIFNNNHACRGGGVCCFESSPEILECVITNNSSNSQSFNLGSGTCSYTGVGGGLFLGSSGGLISNCTISKNFGYGGNASGVGIYCYHSEPVFKDCVISHHRSERSGDGAGMVSNHSSPTLENCFFKDNEADDQGGGLLNTNYSDTILRSCLFTGNSASGGGAIRCWEDSHLTLYNCTINNNSATYVGGIRVFRDSFVNMTNCILWANTGSYYSGENSQIRGGTLTINYSHIQDWSGAHGGIGNSGDNPLITIDGHLSINSPCINQGDPAYTPVPLETDIDGELRITNDRIDIGADEFNFTPVADISERFFVFSAIQGGSNPDAQILYITNVGTGQMDWQIYGDCNWLDVSPRTGSSAGETHQVSLNCDISYLTAGLYTCELSITTAAINPTQTVWVHLNIYDADVLYVPDEFPTIQSAIDWAYDGATILVADGIYTGEGNRDIDFKGKSITVRSESGPENCIIDCQKLGGGFYFHSGEGANSIIDGFTIINANVTGIFCRESGPTISNCNISNCSAGTGGGIYCRDNSCATITNCNIISNIAGHGGGIACKDGSNATITNCAIIGNISYEIGGGVYCTSSIVTVTNCTVIGNRVNGSLGGSGISCRDGNIKITNCTISNNISYYSGVILCQNANLTIANCILWGCLSGQITDRYNDSVISVSYSDIEGGWPGEANIDADPCFVNPDSNDFHLLPDSPCIDAGTNNPPGGLPETDLDGKRRIKNGIVDMGAYEFGPDWYVDAVNGDDNNDGLNRETAFATIQKGIYSAEVGETVSVYPGVYNETIDFLGKAIIVQSAKDAAMLQAQDYFAVLFYHGEGADSILKNFVIKDSFFAIFIDSSSPTISNVTVADNIFGIAAYGGAQPDISNSIFWNNIYGDLFGCQARYSCVQDGCAGPGNLDINPLFADPNNGDYHLKSEGWSWDIKRNRWTYDDVTSRCIDAGNPGSPLGNELLSIPDDPNNIWGQNLRINMGAYGGTTEASMPPYDWAILGDLTNDGLVNFEDYAFQAANWLNSADQQPGDLNRDSLIDISDLALLVEDWLRQTTWHE